MSDETGATWHQLVPELYYDLIARIPPGVVLWLLAGLWAAPKWRKHVAELSLEHFPFGLTFIVLLLLAYVAGIVIVPLSNAVQSSYKSWAWKRLCAGYGEYVTRLAERFLASTRSSDAPPLEPVRMSSKEIHAFQGFLHEALKHNKCARSRNPPEDERRSAALRQSVHGLHRRCHKSHCLGAELDAAHMVWCAIVAGLLAATAAPYRYLRLLQRRIAYAFALGYCLEATDEMPFVGSIMPSGTA